MANASTTTVKPAAAPATTTPVPATTTPVPEHSRPATSSTDSSNPGHEHNASGGSPATIDRPDAGEAGKNATDGNKSPTTVAGIGSQGPGNANSPAGSTTSGVGDTSGETRTPTEGELDEIDEIEDPIDRFDAKEEILENLNEDEIDASHNKVVRLVAALPVTTPDVTTFGGFGGVVITMGDLRNIARRHRSNI